MPLTFHKDVMVRGAAALEGQMTFDSVQDDFWSWGLRGSKMSVLGLGGLLWSGRPELSLGGLSMV